VLAGARDDDGVVTRGHKSALQSTSRADGKSERMFATSEEL
jgi:hypothetical protein